MKRNTYNIRTKNLVSIGYNSYKQYLESVLWSCIKRAVLVRDHCACRNPVCRVGKSRPKQVHHISYDTETLLGANCSTLVTLCDVCHRSVEYNKSGKKLPLKFVVKNTLKMLGLKKIPRREQNALTCLSVYSELSKTDQKYAGLLLEYLRKTYKCLTLPTEKKSLPSLKSSTKSNKKK